jgi:hypothetical protein
MMHMQHQLATMRMAGAIQQSTDVMKSMQQLVKVPEIMNTMREMVSNKNSPILTERFLVKRAHKSWNNGRND